MKTISKAILIFVIFFGIAIFQACWDRCDHSIFNSQILSFDIKSSWTANDTISYDKIEFSMDMGDFSYYTCLNNNCSLIKKTYAVEPTFYYTDTIASISIISDNNYDSLHPAGTNLNDIIFVQLRYVEPYFDINSVIKDTLSNIPFPIRVHPGILFNILDSFPPQTTNVHNFTIIYKETDSTILNYKLPTVVIKQ